MLQRFRQWLINDNGATPASATTRATMPLGRALLRRDDHQFIIIGMGRFGTSLAESLIAQGQSVLAVDSDYQRIQAISADIPHLVHIDATNLDALREIGADHYDTAVVCIGTNFENNLLATVQLRKLGVRRLVSKAQTRTQRDILLQVGADEVILPEHEAGIRLARRLSAIDFLDYMELGSDVGVMELVAPERLHGCTLADTELRKEHGLTVLAIWRGDHLEVNPSPDTCIQAGDKLLVFGKVADARRWSQ
jgi:trk system potassium uptake protein TrkA